jgi:hypothetical protein
LKQKLLIQCPPLPKTTTTSPLTSTVSTTACSLRCSLETEFDHQVGRQIVINDELRKIITKQDFQIVELAMMIREIGSRP